LVYCDANDVACGVDATMQRPFGYVDVLLACFPAAKYPECSIAEFSVGLRTCVTWNVDEEVPLTIVPTSEGWPPPWAWKIVDDVVRIMGSEGISGGGLKRRRVSSGKEERGCNEVMGLVCKWRVLSFW
jgi:hypothetical protein